MKITIRLASLFLVVFTGAASAQAPASPETKDVMAVVTRVFDGMKEADSAKVRTAFAPGARFVTVGTRTNPDTVTYPAVDGWLAGIANSNRGWEEKVKNVRIVVDGNIASAWMDYTFHFNGALRHCGANSFEFIKLRGEWKITQLSDSRRMTGCEG